MSENTAKAACTQAEFDMARKAGLFIGTTEDERALHAFAELVRDEPLPVPEYCEAYHCAGDCGLPHNQAYMTRLASAVYFRNHRNELEAVSLAQFQEDLKARTAKHQAFEDRVLRLLSELEEEGMLTEGQCTEVWGGDRMDWRIASRPMPPAFGQEP